MRCGRMLCPMFACVQQGQVKADSMRPDSISAALIVTILFVSSGCHHGHGAEPPAASDATAPSEPEGAATELNIAIPIAAGRTEAWKTALSELAGPRYGEYDSSRRRFGLTSQTTFLQETPMGDFALIHMTGADVRASFHAMSTSQDPWDVRWRALTADLHGIDFARGEKVTPRVVPIYSMQDEVSPPAKAFMFLAPLAPGAKDRFTDLGREIMGVRHESYLKSRRQLGIQKELVCLETSAFGDAAVFYWVATDPLGSIDAMSRSTEPFDSWLRSEASAVHPLDLTALRGIVAQNSLVASYPKKAAQ
jgi:hypothetical protein